MGVFFCADNISPHDVLLDPTLPLHGSRPCLHSDLRLLFLLAVDISHSMLICGFSYLSFGSSWLCRHGLPLGSKFRGLIGVGEG